MTWTELAPKIEEALRVTGYVNSVYEGDVYDVWNNTNVQYVSACYDEVSHPKGDTDSLETYNVIVYVADRLTEDASNSRYARDFARAVLKGAVAMLRRSVLAVDYTDLTPFVQKFADNLGGYYTTLTIQTADTLDNC